MGDAVDGWDALHEGTGREAYDAPERFDLTTVSGLTRRQPSSIRAEPPRAARQVRVAPQQRQQPPADGTGPPRFQHRSLVRPYARTGGRTRPGQELNLESLVSTSPLGRRYVGADSTVQRFICDLCSEVRSVAEVAAYARLPLGVVKVIVDDLAEAGAVEIHQPGFVVADRSSRDFMSRILDGLRAL